MLQIFGSSPVQTISVSSHMYYRVILQPLPILWSSVNSCFIYS